MTATPLVASMPTAAVHEALGSSDLGLSAAEAVRRLAAVGPNAMPKAKHRSLVRWFLGQFLDLFAVMLLAAAGLTLLAYRLQSPRDPGNLRLALAIVAIVVLNAVIGFLQEYSAERTAEALDALVPRTARVLRDGRLADIAAAEIVPGDVIVLEAGDAVSADCRLVEAHELTLDNSSLTGESEPVSRSAAPAPLSTPTVEAANCVFMGTTVVHGGATGVVFATGPATEFGRIFTLTSTVEPANSPLQREVATVAKRVGTVAGVLGVGIFALRQLTTAGPVLESFVFALGVMVALVPEGLPATMSVSLAVGVRRMARKHALLKRLVAVETLGSATVVCSDKTGTLTQAEMTVQVVWESGRRHDVTGLGYGSNGSVQDPATAIEVLRIGSLCTNARRIPPGEDGRWGILGDTTEGAILVAAVKAGLDLEAIAAASPRLTELPFDSDRKLMTVVCETGTGITAFVKGAPQELLDRCVSVEWNGDVVDLSVEVRAQIIAMNDEFAIGALRVLAVARRTVSSAHPGPEEAENQLTFVGLVGMIDPPRHDALDAVQACRRAGIRVIMVTGDYGLTAEAIAGMVGIVTAPPGLVVSGAEMGAMDDSRLRGVLASHDEIVFARVKPEQKLRLVSVLKATGETVAVTGDGVNDAPALRLADIGIAMGIAGTDVARAAAEMVLLDDSFSSIATAVERGRSVYQNIRRFLVYVFVSNVSELVPLLIAAAVGFPLVPLSALQVLVVDLGSEVMPALALGAEQPERGLMDRPPRPRAERLFSGAVLRRILFLGLIQSLGVTVAFFWKIHSAHRGFDTFTVHDPVYRQAITISQAAIVVSQVFVSFTVRTDRQSLFSIGIFSNPLQVAAGALGIAIVSAISYVPTLQSVFNTAALGATDWALVIAFGALAFAADEARKAWHRSRGIGLVVSAADRARDEAGPLALSARG